MSDPHANPAVAVIGLSGRWPGAATVQEFWRNVRDGVESITRFTPDELEIADQSIAMGPEYVRARSVVADADLFDAGFFGILPKEAELIDPQQRVFLECCWEALEDAGYDPRTVKGAIGVMAGSCTNTYFLRNICSHPKFIDEYVDTYPLGNYAPMLGALTDSLATRVSYKLNLRGPSCTIQTACSTSLVAICQACQSLLTYQSDMALAGGVAITFPQQRGYRYQDGGMGSADGYCRPFDANARGTVFGSGAGVVLLKRLEDALADGDQVHAVIRGFAVNNDGSEKVGYTAPSAEGQANVIAAALAMADVDVATIGYLEGHGTATPLGDPIEFAGLTRAFRSQTSAAGFCALGSVKGNIGHLEAASGVSGLINAIQALKHEELPPLLGFQSPNPNIDVANSPFYFNTSLSPWKRGEKPRRAGVSSFGVGGTNAHVVLEEAPVVRQAGNADAGSHLLVLSARSAEALERSTDRLVQHLRSTPEIDLDSVAFTLQTGRRAFEHRRIVACRNRDDAIEALERRDRSVSTSTHEGDVPPIVFMFPGQGSQYVNMGAELYRSDSGFRADVDECAEILQQHLGFDLRAALYTSGESLATLELRDTSVAQPALFVTEYALARLWMRWGVQPQAMIGHSVGEFVSACLAGVFSLPDVLAIVATRARMMQELPPGAMLSVRLGEEDVAPLLNGKLSLAAANGPSLSVVSGPEEAIENFSNLMTARSVATRRLVTSHAFHSRMMDPIIHPFTECIARFRLSAPRLPFVSGVSGEWITDEEATDPAYWGRHFREPVRFSKGIQLLQNSPERVYLEVGPGRVLCTLTAQHRNPQSRPAVASLPDANSGISAALAVKQAVGALWLRGVTPNWAAMHAPDVRRCSLPTYPFERSRHWIDPPSRLPARPSSPLPNSESPMSAPAPAPMPEPAPMNESLRQDRLRSNLIDIFQDLSGLSLAGFDSSATFLEMGFDSLFLTQVSQAIQGKFGVKITFRQLLDRESTLNTLSAFLDSKLPAEALPAPVQAVASVVQSAPVAAPISAVAKAPAGQTNSVGLSSIEALMREQIQAMSQLVSSQLDLLRGPGHTSNVSVIAPVAPAASLTVPANPSEAVKPAAAQEFKPFGPYKPVQRGTVGGLTEQQSGYLESFIHKYTSRTAKSKESTQAHRRRLSDPRVVSGFRAQWKEMVYPIVTVRSRGSKLWDLDGNEYIDIVNGFGPILFGHAPEFVTDAVTAQLHDGFEIGPQTPLAGEVADLVCEVTGNERVAFCNTGSEAVMAAIRVARTVTARQKIVLFAGSYHGTFDEVLVKGIQKDGSPHSLPIAPGIPREKVANVVVLNYGTPEALEYIRSHASELAAVLVEPVQSRHPALRPVEFLKEIRKITEASETALIIDEIVTGFRTHPGGIQALFDIRADLVTYGKVAGGGMPIGMLAGRARFMDALDGGMWQYGDDSFPEVGVTFFAGTFVRHPLALAATRAIMMRLRDEGPALQERLAKKAAALVERINSCFERHDVPSRLENFTSWFYFSFLSEQPYGSLLYYHLRAKGIHIQEGFPCFITAAHSDGDLDRIARAFEESIEELQGGGFLLSGTAGESRPAHIAPSAAVLPREVPLTEPQMEIWLSARISDEASCSFNESLVLRMRGRLNAAALHKALQQLVERHDALRSTFDSEKNCVRTLDAVLVDLPLVDLSSLSEPERAAELEKLTRAEASLPFDLDSGPLVRVQLVRLQPDHHELLFTTHHIVCDGWSTNVLLGELGALYTALDAGTSCTLPAPMPFREYALSQAKAVAADRVVGEWWAAKFATPVSPLELPTDRPRGSLKSYRGGTVRRTIDSAACQRLKRFGAQQGCTLFATMLAGFKILLHRLTGQSDIVVGIPAAGQSLVESDSLVGHCVNFLPLRTVFEDDVQTNALLTHVRGTLLDAYDHQNYTYGSLLKRLNLVRDPSRLPLVEVQFNLERLGSDLSFPELKVEVDPCPKSFVNFDLFLNVVESETGLVLDCDFNRDLFDPATVERWLGHLEVLLEGMAADSRRPVAVLPLLSVVERTRMLEEWNHTRIDYPRDKCIHQLISEQAARTPASIAAVCDGRELTYFELDASANRLARFLQKQGVRNGDRVAICLDRSTDMLVGVLGILKAGAAYVPLDPEFPRDRIAAVMADSEPALLLTQESVASRLQLTATRVVCQDLVKFEIDRESDHTPDCPVSPGELAYVIYTSGSTGKPKGVQIPHRAAVNLLCSMAREPGLTAQDTLLAVTTLSFDIAVLELFLPLCVGGRVVIATRDATSDGHKLLALISSTRTTVMQATPASWRLLIEAGWSGRSKLRILCGGEALPRDLADALLARSGSVWNMYGPTETTVWSATSQVGPHPISLGPPIANTEFYVLDPKTQPLPIGVAGELHIGGEGVACGYWNRPELTSEKFIADPFAKEAGRKLYKTGDLVRRLADGSLEFLGRIDTQVKVRGFRIETAEVELVLNQHAGIRDCVVVAREDQPGDKRLVAYFVAAESKPTSEDLRRHIAAKLPAYMVPSLFVSLGSLPKTPNGKIDRRSLPAPNPATSGRPREVVAPRGRNERVLLDVCAQVLEVTHAGVLDSIFDLGADSLQVFQIVARANAAGIAVTPKMVLSGRTVAAICEELDKAAVASPRVGSPPLSAVSRDRYRIQRSQLPAAGSRIDGAKQ